MHLAHELMKMQPRLALEGDCVVKAIHEKTLAPPYSTKHVHAPWDVRAVDQLFQRVGAFLFVRSPLLRATLQFLHRAQLGRVRRVTPDGQFGFVDLLDGQGNGS